MPSKALIRSARFLAHAHRARELGFDSASVDFDFARVMERVQRVIRQVEPHDSVDRYTRLGVNCIQGEAQITSPYTVQVNGRTLTTRNIIVATGRRPAVLPIHPDSLTPAPSDLDACAITDRAAGQDDYSQIIHTLHEAGGYNLATPGQRTGNINFQDNLLNILLSRDKRVPGR